MDGPKTLSDAEWGRKLIGSLRRSDGAWPRLAIVGIGQTLWGDDGAGPAVTRRLAELVSPSPNLLILDAGHAPENCLGPIIRFNPQAVLLVDAIRANAVPGALFWLDIRDAEAAGGSTHTLSLATLGGYLEAESGAAIYLLGIQPERLAFGEALTEPVAASVEQAATAIAGYWRKAVAACSAISTGDVSVVNT